MRIWIDYWRFEFYFALQWYKHPEHTTPWYKGKFAEIQFRDFPPTCDVSGYILFFNYSITWVKFFPGRWNDEQ